ncbi:MAG: TrkA C-terminal domain-containing protein [Pseudomonadota bacterium]
MGVSPFAGRALCDLSLADRDVRVLSVARDATVLPDPRGSEVLHAGDVLLCFGSYATLGELLADGHVPAA